MPLSRWMLSTAQRVILIVFIYLFFINWTKEDWRGIVLWLHRTLFLNRLYFCFSIIKRKSGNNNKLLKKSLDSIFDPWKQRKRIQVLLSVSFEAGQSRHEAVPTVAPSLEEVDWKPHPHHDSALSPQRKSYHLIRPRLCCSWHWRHVRGL